MENKRAQKAKIFLKKIKYKLSEFKFHIVGKNWAFNKMMKDRHLSYRLGSEFAELLMGCEMKDKIGIVRLHMHPTYRGLTCGIPDDEMNKEFIADAEKKASDLFGSPPVYTIPSKITLNPAEMEGGRIFQSPRLPNYTMLVSLETFEIEGHYDGRRLAVVLFADDIYTMPIDQIIRAAIREMDWKEHSQLWSFADF